MLLIFFAPTKTTQFVVSSTKIGVPVGFRNGVSPYSASNRPRNCSPGGANSAIRPPSSFCIAALLTNMASTVPGPRMPGQASERVADSVSRHEPGTRSEVPV